MDLVFVVDDQADFVFMTRLLLQRSGYAVSGFNDGPSALAAAQAQHPAAILLDIGMPPMDGYEVCRRLRAQPGGESIAMLALTGYGRAGDIAAAKAAGFDAHLLKPVNLDEMLRVLANCITKRQGEPI